MSLPSFKEYLQIKEQEKLDEVGPKKKTLLDEYKDKYHFDKDVFISKSEDSINDNFILTKQDNNLMLYTSKSDKTKFMLGRFYEPINKQDERRFGIIKSNIFRSKDYLNEAEAKFGNFSFSSDIFKTLDVKALKRKYDYVDKINEYSLYREKHDAVFVLCEELDNEAFDIIFSIKLTRLNNISNKISRNSELHLKKLYNVDGVALKDVDNMRSSGIASNVYMYLVQELGYSILGDKEQYLGARRLWTKLSKRKDTLVNIVNTATGEILFSDYEIKHGKADDSFDPNVWTTDDSTHHIRTLLTSK